MDIKGPRGLNLRSKFSEIAQSNNYVIARDKRGSRVYDISLTMRGEEVFQKTVM